MNHDDARALLARLLARIAPEVDVASEPDDTALQDDLGLDSMDVLNLMTALHDETGLDVPERDYPRLATIGAFATYVSEATP